MLKEATNCATHHAWNCLLLKCLRVGSWIQRTLFGSSYPNLFCQTTNQAQLAGCGKRVSSLGFCLWWSSLSMTMTMTHPNEVPQVSPCPTDSDGEVVTSTKRICQVAKSLLEQVVRSNTCEMTGGSHTLRKDMVSEFATSKISHLTQSGQCGTEWISWAHHCTGSSTWTSTWTSLGRAVGTWW